MKKKKTVWIVLVVIIAVLIAGAFFVYPVIQERIEAKAQLEAHQQQEEIENANVKTELVAKIEAPDRGRPYVRDLKEAFDKSDGSRYVLFNTVSVPNSNRVRLKIYRTNKDKINKKVAKFDRYVSSQNAEQPTPDLDTVERMTVELIEKMFTASHGKSYYQNGFDGKRSVYNPDLALIPHECVDEYFDGSMCKVYKDNKLKTKCSDAYIEQTAMWDQHQGDGIYTMLVKANLTTVAAKDGFKGTDIIPPKDKTKEIAIIISGVNVNEMWFEFKVYDFAIVK